jgi:RimJ/RimL family protein N-acetyltransferase
MPEVRPSQPSDARPHWEHYKRIISESGRDGDFIFSPIEEWVVPLEEFLQSYDGKLNKSVLENGWERAWVIADQNGIYGDLHLVHRPPLKSCIHRATLMMGIERSHRGMGLGSRLMQEAISWAKEQPTLEWLQLFVFEGNQPAKKLYSKFGFRENGTTPDMFRVHQTQVADTSMILKLK